MRLLITLLTASLLAASPVMARDIKATTPHVGGSANADLLRLDGNTLFAFAKADLTPAGKQAIDAALKKAPTLLITPLKITGHTDDQGSSKANYDLSFKRAEAVRKYLQAKGHHLAIDVAGRGETEPLVKCNAKLPKAELVKCLQPNRRVDVEVVYGS